MIKVFILAFVLAGILVYLSDDDSEHIKYDR